ncbi:hypothetical protein [Kitasatospora sp. NPDC004531]
MRRAVLPNWLLLAAPIVALVASLLTGLSADRSADGPGATAQAAAAVPVALPVGVPAGSAGSVAEEEPESTERGRGSTTPAPTTPVRRDSRKPGTAARAAAGTGGADGRTAPRTPPDTAGRPAPAGPAALQVFRC